MNRGYRFASMQSAGMRQLGLFIGILGRERVSIIHDEGIELPSDINGLLYTSHDPSGNWRLSIAKEMKAGGISVDLNRL
jgi:predicted nucleotide-binding protein